MKTNNQKSWQNLPHADRKATYQSLKRRVAGVGWYYSYLHEIEETDLRRFKLRLILSHLKRSFRYVILNETIGGTRLGLYGQQERRKRRLRSISKTAKDISTATGVRFEKVYPELLRRMLAYFD